MSKESVIAEMKRKRLEREKAENQTGGYALQKNDISNSDQYKFNQKFYAGKA